MSYAAKANAKRITPHLFGDTDIAGGIPLEYQPSPSKGPVYFEGKLVLALSFQDEAEGAAAGERAAAGKPQDTLQLWDSFAGAWFDASPIIARYKDRDVVYVDGAPVYCGAVDNARDVTMVPGWSSDCTAINNQYYLQWKSQN